MTTVALSTRLAGAPEQYREPTSTPSLEAARAWCKQLAESHYENFHVATWFLPAALRPHFHAIYAYCRIADDFSDEVGDPLLALRLLEEWEEMLYEVYDAPDLVRHPVFVALTETVRVCGIPRDPFSKLLISFRKDQTFTHYRTVDELSEYSASSANPVGHLVLYASGYDDPELRALSDKTCTALQYANFWQDVGQDFHERQRIYLPVEEMERFGVTLEQVKHGKVTPEYRELMRYLVGRTRVLFAEGSRIEEKVNADLASTLRLFREGGLAILSAIEAIDYDTLTQRPVVSKSAKLRLLSGALFGKLTAPFRGRKGTEIAR